MEKSFWGVQEGLKCEKAGSSKRADFRDGDFQAFRPVGCCSMYL
jgi:hypothetical protein